MKKSVLLLFTFLVSGLSFSQEYSCPELKQDIEIWNSIKDNSNTKWANAIKEKGLYNQNADGSFEYVYILNSTDSINITTLRNIGFNYIAYYFNIDNASRANLEINSPKDGVIFSGKLNGIGEFLGFGEYNKINANIIFDIRFKPNRIRFSVKIQDYQVIKTSGANIIENRQAYVKDCFPLNPNSDHKKSYAMAFINANSNCLNYAKHFLDYVERNIKTSQPTITEDW